MRDVFSAWLLPLEGRSRRRGGGAGWRKAGWPVHSIVLKATGLGKGKQHMHFRNEGQSLPFGLDRSTGKGERNRGKIENAVKIVATSERFSNNQK